MTISGYKKNLVKGVKKNAGRLFRLALATLFSLAGYLLLIRSLKREQNEKKEKFLQLIALYAWISFLVFIPLAVVLELRYFLILQFIPFILLGLIMKFLQEKYGAVTFYFSLIILGFLVFLNVSQSVKEYKDFTSGKGDVGIAIWSEEKFVGDFILAHSQPGQKIYFISEPQNANKFIRSLSYFNETIDAPEDYNDPDPLNERDVAYFSLILDTKKENKQFSERMEKAGTFQVTDSASYGRLKIMKLDLK
jgi:hypothetical protein